MQSSILCSSNIHQFDRLCFQTLRMAYKILKESELRKV